MNPGIQIRREVASHAATKILVEAAQAALDESGIRGAQLTIVLTDSRRMRRLNARYAGEDTLTDVLAFPSEGDPGYLGDVIIAIPHVRQQARRRGVPFTHELRLLIVHGTLHLVGHDHHRAVARRKMWAAQSRALRRLGLDPDRLGVDR